MGYIDSSLLLLGLIAALFFGGKSLNRITNIRIFVAIQNYLNGFSDYIYPSAKIPSMEWYEQQNLRMDERIRIQSSMIDNAWCSGQDLSKVNEGLSKAEGSEIDRIKIIEGKLSSLLMMTGILVTVALVFANGKGSSTPFFHVFTSYCVLQMICLLSAVQRGLERQPFSQPSVSGLMLFWLDSDPTDRISMLKARLESLEENMQRGNNKVTQLAIAHTAFRNFRYGLGIIFVALCLSKPAPDYKFSDFMNDLERHPIISELLRIRSDGQIRCNSP